LYRGSDLVSPSCLISFSGLIVFASNGGENLNKKILAGLISLLIVVLLVTPLVSLGSACGRGRRSNTVVPYENSIALSVIPETTEVQWSGDGTVVIRKGTQRVGAYDGPLGVGTMYSEAIVSVTKFEVPPSGTPSTSIGHGGAIYKERYVIDSGPFGAGTLEGVCVMKWDINTVDFPQYYDYVGYSTFGHGTSGLAGITLKYETTGSALPPYPPGLQQGIMVLS
jgi:hypothetical protein